MGGGSDVGLSQWGDLNGGVPMGRGGKGPIVGRGQMWGCPNGEISMGGGRSDSGEGSDVGVSQWGRSQWGGPNGPI